MGLNPNLWQGKRVLVTGHTGFKGSWLTLLLKELGADVVGISLQPQGERSLYVDAKLGEDLTAEFFQDIRDNEAIEKIIHSSRIDYVFHLAAQALVRRSVMNPIETITTNVLGTVNVLLPSLSSKNIIGVTIVTTDKVYENSGLKMAFRESDKLGGQDPYSSSKAAAELVVSSICLSSNPRHIPVTTVRAGNVIGGGDWAEDRLVPDIVRAIYANETLFLRNPEATRPWQHVLDCLYGYLLVAQTHFQGMTDSPKSINFGPEDSVSVTELVGFFEEVFGKKILTKITKSQIAESSWLSLDSTLANRYLGWKPSLSSIQAVSQTANWYSQFTAGVNAKRLMKFEISAYRVGKW